MSIPAEELEPGDHVYFLADDGDKVGSGKVMEKAVWVGTRFLVRVHLDDFLAQLFDPRNLHRERTPLLSGLKYRLQNRVDSLARDREEAIEALQAAHMALEEARGRLSETTRELNRLLRTE